MIARRIITVVLFLIVMLFLELNQHSAWGMYLTVLMIAEFFMLFEAELLPGIPQRHQRGRAISSLPRSFLSSRSLPKSRSMLLTEKPAEKQAL